MMDKVVRLHAIGILILAVLPFMPSPVRATSVYSAASPTQWDALPEGVAWGQFARRAIDSSGSDLVSAEPRDIATYCPNYAALNQLHRQAFWIAFLSALAHAESKDDPSKRRLQLYDGDAHRPAIRRGLFQVSVESANRRVYQCDVAHARDLADPQENITCAVRILSHWVGHDNVIADQGAWGWRGPARYWRSLRRAAKRRAIAASTAHMPLCIVQ